MTPRACSLRDREACSPVSLLVFSKRHFGPKSPSSLLRDPRTRAIERSPPAISPGLSQTCEPRCWMAKAIRRMNRYLSLSRTASPSFSAKCVRKLGYEGIDIEGLSLRPALRDSWTRAVELQAETFTLQYRSVATEVVAFFGG